MPYNLTPDQKEALRWIVEKAQADEIPEANAYFRWYSGKPSVASRDVDPPKVIQPGVLDVLGKEDLLHVRRPPRDRRDRVVTLRKGAYDAVESDFSG